VAKKIAVIVDVDGTVANCTHRLHHITNGRKNWKGFFDAMDMDVPYQPIVKLLDLLPGSVSIVFCSGRPEEYRSLTERWFSIQNIFFDALFMRSTGDTRPDHIVKKEILAQIREEYDPFLVIDDRQSVVDMWRAEGLTCLQCRDPQEALHSNWGKLTIMVGPSGAGKSTWLFKNAYSPKKIISSDEIRQELTGNSLDQTRNPEVFEAINKIAKARLSSGLDTVIDATHIKRKDRIASVSLVPSFVPVEYVVIDRPLQEKNRDGGWRLSVGFDLIGRHHNTFMQNIKDILRGDSFSNVSVRDCRSYIGDEPSPSCAPV
jgi:predicted kinase